jgi:hypothetical protein
VPAADVGALIGPNDGGNAAAPVGDGGNTADGDDKAAATTLAKVRVRI